jgi:hypothetical protein
MRRPYWRAIALVSLSLVQLTLWQGATASNALARGHSAPGVPGAVFAAVGDAYNHFPQNAVSPGSSNTTLAKLSVPEGNYVIHANVDFTNSTSVADLLSCNVEDTTFLNNSVLHSITSPTFSVSMLSFTAVMSFSGSTTVVLQCSVVSPSSNKLAVGELTMIRIGTITRQ